jgi:hypothetical protein
VRIFRAVCGHSIPQIDHHPAREICDGRDRSLGGGAGLASSIAQEFAELDAEPNEGYDRASSWRSPKELQECREDIGNIAVWLEGLNGR